ncbi:MAG: N-6 DNA methylase [Ruminococcus sp.]|nr:N-6 DNA methylase [Ruminococcus sp.]
MAKTTKQQYAEIVKLFNALTGARQLWELWEDAMIMFATMLSNAVDKRFFDKREEMFKNVARKYDEKEIQLFLRIFAEIVNQLEIEPEQDFLGDLYMQLDLGSHWHGQFFTPYNVCKMTADLQLPAELSFEDAKAVTITDCACGGGALLIASAHAYRTKMAKIGLNAQDFVCLYAQDLSMVAALMCYIQISLQGYAGKIKIGDSLLHPMLDTDNGSDIWYTPMWFSDVWAQRRAVERIVGGLRE